MKINLTHIVEEEESMRDGICGGGVGGDDMYSRSTEPVLDLLSDLYSEKDRISQ